MYCPYCGNEINNGDLFCGKCGSKTMYDEPEDIKSSSPPPIPILNSINTTSPRDNSFKKRKIIVPVIICLLVLFIILELSSLFTGSNKYIEMVKGGHPKLYPDKTYEEAFNNFFINPEWSYKKTPYGQDIVQFDGDCTNAYNGKMAHMIIQFDVNKKEKTFYIYSLEFDGIPQNQTTIKNIQDTIFQN